MCPRQPIRELVETGPFLENFRAGGRTVRSVGDEDQRVRPSDHADRSRRTYDPRRFRPDVENNRVRCSEGEPLEQLGQIVDDLDIEPVAREQERRHAAIPAIRGADEHAHTLKRQEITHGFRQHLLGGSGETKPLRSTTARLHGEYVAGLLAGTSLGAEARQPDE